LEIAAPTFIEIGCGNGLENNTHFIALKGSPGVWIDGSEKNIKLIQSWSARPARPKNKIIVSKSFVTASNVVGLLESLMGQFAPVRRELCDFLSVDVDGNDVSICQTVFRKISPKSCLRRIQRHSTSFGKRHVQLQGRF
jgi:hypothetical protein